MKKNLLLCVATEKGLAVLEAVHQADIVADIIVCSFEESSVSESYNRAIQDYANQHNITLLDWKNIKSQATSIVETHKIWAIVCVGWKYLIPTEISRLVDDRVLVTHDSLLPRYRGYAPLATALINGDETVGVTVLQASDEVDAGDILYQKEVKVAADDTISVLIKKLLPLFSEGVLSSLEKIMSDKPEKITQDHAKATYSIWRDEEDLYIDWSQPADVIERSIRALGPPYLGARTRLGNEIVVLQSSKVEPELDFEIRQTGKVWKLSDKGEPVVICGEGLLKISAAEINGESIIPMKRLRTRFY